MSGYPMDGTRVVRVSGDRKTGPVAATYREVGPSCPSDCPLMGAGCYAQRGRVSLWAREQPEGDLDDAAGMDLLRWFVSGEAMRPWGNGVRLDVAYVEKMLAWHDQTPRTTGWGYCHGWRKWDQAGLGPDAWPDNFLMLASCHTEAERDEAKAAGWKTARVIDEPEERAEGECFCPYDKAKHEGETPRVTCRTCRLCWEGDLDIAFLKL